MEPILYQIDLKIQDYATISLEYLYSLLNLINLYINL